VNMIAMAHNKDNSKEAHMGHPPSNIDEGYDEEESGDGENESEGDSSEVGKEKINYICHRILVLLMNM
jgi:hypothetical protein